MAYLKNKIKRGDNVRVITGAYKGAEGKVLKVDVKQNRLIVEGANMQSHHTKPSGQEMQGGIIKREGMIHASNVMYLHNGEPTRIGYTVEEEEKNGKTIRIKRRVAKSTGDIID